MSHMFCGKYSGRALALFALLTSAAGPAPAQGFWKKVAAAAQQASTSIEEGRLQLAMSKATPVALDDRGLSTIAIAGVGTFGVVRVDILDTVGVRLHAYVQNPTAGPLVIEGLDANAFTLTDAMGKRLRSVGRLRGGARTPSDALTVAPGQRVKLTLLFAADGAGGNATLSLSPALSAGGVIAGIPVRSDAISAQANAGAMVPSPNAPGAPSQSSSPYPPTVPYSPAPASAGPDSAAAPPAYPPAYPPADPPAYPPAYPPAPQTPASPGEIQQHQATEIQQYHAKEIQVYHSGDARRAAAPGGAAYAGATSYDGIADVQGSTYRGIMRLTLQSPLADGPVAARVVFSSGLSGAGALTGSVQAGTIVLSGTISAGADQYTITMNGQIGGAGSIAGTYLLSTNGSVVQTSSYTIRPAQP